MGLQALVPTAANQLQRLHDELDLADAAGSQLDVVGELAPRDFTLDERLHLAQALEHSVVQVPPEDERAHRRRIELRIERRARDRARLHIGVAFPVASMARQIILERSEARHERPAVTERPQAQIDAQNEAVVGRHLEQTDDALTEPGEEFFVGDSLRPVGLAGLREQQHQVDVGGEVQLAAAQFPHRDDDQLLGYALLGPRLAETRDQRLPGIAASAINRRIRESGQLG